MGGRRFLLVAKHDATVLVRLDEGHVVTFGRSSEATIKLDDPKASRLHTEVRAKSGKVFVKDLGSRNGTKINGARFTGEERTVTSSDRIAIDRTEIDVVDAADESGEGEIRASDRRAEILARALLLGRAMQRGSEVTLGRDACVVLSSYGWPDGHGELKAAMAFALKQSGGAIVRARDLPIAVRSGPPTLNERAPSDLGIILPKGSRSKP